MASPPSGEVPGDRVVLLVEDEAVLRASMVRGLMKLPGVVVRDAGTVAEALRIAEGVRPAVLVCDIDLPDGSGIELVGRLESRGERYPTIFMSAYLPRFRQQLAQRPGVVMLEKPVPIAHLRELVAERLGGAADRRSSPFALTDYLQLAGMGRRTVLLDVTVEGRRAGEVLVRTGQAWSAHDDGGTGLDALMRLIARSDAVVTCTTPPDGLPSARTLTGSCEHVLLEAMRRIDEQRRPSSHPRPPAAADEQYDELLLDEHGRLTLPPPATPAPPPPPPPSPAVEAPPSDFASFYERGVDALLARDHAAAYALFVAASRFGTSTSLEANLKRLRGMGFGS